MGVNVKTRGGSSGVVKENGTLIVDPVSLVAVILTKYFFPGKSWVSVPFTVSRSVFSEIIAGSAINVSGKSKLGKVSHSHSMRVFPPPVDTGHLKIAWVGESESSRINPGDGAFT